MSSAVHRQGINMNCPTDGIVFVLKACTTIKGCLA